MSGVPKVVRDGKVAVIISPGFGAGWSTWGAGERGLFSPEIVEAIETGGDREEAARRAGIDCYMGGLLDAVIHWVPVGTRFRVDEYDGFESIEEDSSIDWVVA